MAIKRYFSQAEIALREEVIKHPELITKIAEAQATDITEAVGHIAAYCGIVVDGLYTQSELNHLYDILYRKLLERRTRMVIPQSQSTDPLSH